MKYLIIRQGIYQVIRYSSRKPVLGSFEDLPAAIGAVASEVSGIEIIPGCEVEGRAYLHLFEIEHRIVKNPIMQGRNEEPIKWQH